MSAKMTSDSLSQEAQESTRPSASDEGSAEWDQRVRDAAQGYLDNGWFVLPISVANEKLTGKHRELSGKLPTALRYYFQTIGKAREGDLHLLQGYGVGIATGRCSGLVVLDVDTEDALEKIKLLGLPETRIVKTYRGQHLYFRHPGPHYFVPSNHGMLWQGIDVKGENGFVTAPPSRHPANYHYYWVNPEVPIADLPESLLEVLLKLRPRRRWKLVVRYLYRKYLRHPLNSFTGR